MLDLISGSWDLLKYKKWNKMKWEVHTTTKKRLFPFFTFLSQTWNNFFSYLIRIFWMERTEKLLYTREEEKTFSLWTKMRSEGTTITIIWIIILWFQDSCAKEPLNIRYTLSDKNTNFISMDVWIYLKKFFFFQFKSLYSWAKIF